MLDRGEHCRNSCSAAKTLRGQRVRIDAHALGRKNPKLQRELYFDRRESP